jgi:peroxiredoxin
LYAVSIRNPDKNSPAPITTAAVKARFFFEPLPARAHKIGSTKQIQSLSLERKPTMKIYKFVLVAGLCAMLVLGSISLADPNAPEKKEGQCTAMHDKDPNIAPMFALTDPNGKEVKLSDFKDKIVILEWFNYDCPFVKALHQSGVPTEMLKKIDKKKVVWLAINSTYYATAKGNQDFITEYKLTYPVLLDPESKVGKLYKAKTSPHIFIINPQGKIVYQGAIDNAPLAKKPDKEAYVNYVEKALDELLAGKDVSIKETKPYGCSVKYPPTEKPAEK